MNLLGGAVTTVVLAACYGTGDWSTSDKYYTPSGTTGDTGTTDSTTPIDTGTDSGTDSGTDTGVPTDTGTDTGVRTDTGVPTDTGAGDTGTTSTHTGTATDSGTTPTDTGTTSTDTAQPAIDADGDGYFLPWDCNDADPTIHPDYPEQCSDGIDNDCDGLVDGADPECP
jgi:hypothetical protein